MKALLQATYESVANMLFVVSIFVSAALYDKNQRIKRRSKLRQTHRKHELARRENERQAKLTRRVWELEDAKDEQKEAAEGGLKRGLR